MIAGGDRFIQIFEMQGTLQRALGYDFNAMDEKVLMEYIRLNVLALTDELHEALAEVNWKPWTTAAPGFKDRELYISELADALHHFVNLCVAAGADADEITAAYIKKSKRNHERQEEGYDGLDKCDGPGCRRALDEPAMLTVTYTWPTGERFCSPECEESRKHADAITGGNV
jgi:dimeric dUTPase (all-alpha-NTP-PPase superfamily)